MPKKEYYCIDCDTNFSVTIERGVIVGFCPVCGEALGEQDSNEYEDD